MATALAAHALATNRDFSFESPLDSAKLNPAKNESPAPVASTTSETSAGWLILRSPEIN